MLRPQPLTRAGRRRADPPARAATPRRASCRDCHRAVGGNPWLLGELGRQIARRPAHGERRRARRHDRRARRRPPAPGGAAAARPRRRRGARGDRRRRAAARRRRAWPACRWASSRPARDALLAAGLLATERGAVRHGLVARGDRRGPGADRARAPAPRGGAQRADGREPRGASPRTCSSAARTATPRSPTSSSARPRTRQRGHAARAAALPRAGAGGARSRRRPCGDCSPTSARSAFDAGLPDAARRLRDSLREPQDDATPDRRADPARRARRWQAAPASVAELLAEQDGPAIEVATLDALVALPGGRASGARGSSAGRAGLGDPALERVGPGAPGVDGARAGGGRGARRRRSRSTRSTTACCSTRRLGAARLPARAARAGAHATTTAMRGSGDRRAARGGRGARLAAAARDRGLDAGELALRMRPTSPTPSATRGGARPRRRRHPAGDAAAGRGAGPRAGRARRVRRGRRGDAAARVDGRCDGRALSHLAMGDFERAHAEACAAGAVAERAALNPTLWPGASTAALALAHLGRRDEAAALADAELARAERFGAPVPIATALHARAVAEPDRRARIALCRRALGASARCGGARACALRLELGSALALPGPARAGARRAAPGAGRRRRRGCRPARQARPARARRDRPAPAPAPRSRAPPR